MSQLTRDVWKSEIPRYRRNRGIIGREYTFTRVNSVKSINHVLLITIFLYISDFEYVVRKEYSWSEL